MSGHTGAEILGVDLDPAPRSRRSSPRSGRRCCGGRSSSSATRTSPRTSTSRSGALFGDVTPAHPTLPAAFPDHPEILLLDNQKYAGDDSTIESRWHTDVTFVLNPPMGSILRGVVVPPYGGDTQFTNLVVAYEKLSAPIRDLIDGLHAVHHNVLPLARGEMPAEMAKIFQSSDLRSVHPVVRVHPETGERAVFVNPNFTSHIVELSRKEGRAPARDALRAHRQPRVHVPLPLGARQHRVLGQPRDRAPRPHRRARRASTARCSASPSPATSPSASTASPPMSLAGTSFA